MHQKYQQRWRGQHFQEEATCRGTGWIDTVIFQEDEGDLKVSFSDEEVAEMNWPQLTALVQQLFGRLRISVLL